MNTCICTCTCTCRWIDDCLDEGHHYAATTTFTHTLTHAAVPYYRFTLYTLYLRDLFLYVMYLRSLNDYLYLTEVIIVAVRFTSRIIIIRITST